MGRRIAFVGLRGLASRWGGVEHHVSAIATRLAARGHDVTAFVRPGYTGACSGVRRAVRPTLPGKHAEAAVHSLLCSLEATIRGFDIVHYQAMGPALFCGLPRLAGRCVVTTIHALDHRRSKWSRMARAALRTGERCAFRFSNRVLVVSRHLERHYAALGRPIRYVPNGVDAGPPQPPREVRARFGLRGDDYLLFVGRWTPEKRVRELVEAFAQAAPRGMRLVVAGAGHARYERQVRASASRATVFPGVVDGAVKEELLANAFAFVSFSDLEGLPLAMLEAMAHGRACVASDIPAHRELLAPDRGVLVAATTPAERVRAFREAVAQGEACRRAIGARARDYVRTHHDWARVVDRLEAIYDEIS